MKSTLALIAGLFIALCGAPRAQRPTGPVASGPINVMTWNAYHGVDAQIRAVGQATSQADLLQKVAAVCNGYFESDFPDRAAVLASEVNVTRPDLIGVQEAILVLTQQPPDGPATPATKVSLDYVQMLLDALAARGLSYKVVTQSIGFDVELPSALGFDVRHTDREVILARADLKPLELTLSNPLAGNFTATCEIPTGFGLVRMRRGWVSVDVNVRGANFRFLSTHLDDNCPSLGSAIQQAQAAELLTGPGATDLPLVLVGDLNSPAVGSGMTYNALTVANGALIDAWIRSRRGAGLTCCQAADLRNVDSMLTQRSDFVLFRGGFMPLTARTVGDQPRLKTSTGRGRPTTRALWRHCSCDPGIRVRRFGSDVRSALLAKSRQALDARDDDHRATNMLRIVIVEYGNER